MPGTTRTTAHRAEPTWEVAYLFPTQGNWSEEDYLALDRNHLIELSDGCLEVLPMPTMSHQVLVLSLYRLLLAFTTDRDLGTVLVAPLRVRLWRDKFREPDVLFLLKEHSARMGNEYWTGADLVMEVVSGEEEDRRRDLVTKRREYARAGVAEYWIVDPLEERIAVLRLAGKRYVVHGEFAPGVAADSALLPGFTVDVTEAFAQFRRAAAAGQSRTSRRRS
jgi:Uma2 family endonuclease